MPILEHAARGRGLEELFRSFLAQDTRLVGLHPSLNAGFPDGTLLARRVTGWEAVNEGFRYEVEVLSPDAFLELKALEGVPVQVALLTAGGARREINGVVMEVRSEGSDGALAAYRLVVEPVTAALKHARAWRVYLGRTDLEVARQLLDEALRDNPVFAACLGVDNRCRGRFPVREFIFQCGETPWDFIRRRLAGIGVSFVFAPAKDGSSDCPQHTLVLFDDPRDLDGNEAGTVRFHRADGTERADSITRWHARRTLQCSRVTRRAWNHAQGACSTAAEEVGADQGPFGNALASTLEDYRHEPPLEQDDLEAPEARAAAASRGWNQRAKAFEGAGSVREFRAGTCFTLSQHPVHDQDPPESREFVLTRVELEAVSNLPEGLAQALGRRGEAGGQVYRNRFECLRRGIPLLPEELPAPVPGLQTATVVGPGQEAVHTDAWGRIKVRLHCARPEDHPEAGATGTDRDSFWIRAVQPWSSQGVGGTFLPRTGDEVLLDFLGNDPDRPVVVGVLPGGTRPPGRFSDASCLPGDRAVSGLRSRVHGGLAGSELLFDDTPGEVRTRLASDHARAELNLGFNVHPRRNGAAEPRGEGAELRTDAAVALRGGQGVLISADARPGAGGSLLSREEALGHLEAVLELARTAGELGVRHGLEGLEDTSQADLLERVRSWEQAPGSRGGRSPILLASAPAGAALASGDGATVQAASNLDLAVMRNLQASAGRRMLFHALESIGLFAHRLGMKLVAASGDVSVQAQDGSAEVVAAKALRLMSVGGPLELDAAKGIVLRSGGAFLEIKDGGIRAGGAAGWLGQFANVAWSGPASREAMTRSFPKSSAKMDEAFVFVDPLGEPAGSMRYRITREDGSTVEGVSDDQGRTELCTGEAAGALDIQVFGPGEA